MNSDQFEQRLREALYREAYRPPLQLDSPTLRERLEEPGRHQPASRLLPVAAVLAGLAVLAVTLGPRLVPTITPSSVGPSASPHSSPPGSSPSLSPVFTDWRRVDMPHPAPGMAAGGTPRDVVAFRSSYVAVGGVFGSCCSETDVYGVVWLSSDGQTWELLPWQAALGRGVMNEAATDGETILVAGGLVPESPNGPFIEAEPALFRSHDGQAWERLAGAPPIHRLTVATSRFIGISTEEGALTAWLNDDGGTTWSRSPLPTPADRSRRAVVASLVGRSDGTVVAVGSIEDQGAPGLARSGTSWVSTDAGETWTWAEEAVPGFALESAASVGGRLFALGKASDRTSTWVFSSEDGLSWSGRELIRHTHPDAGAFSSFFGSDRGLVFTGYDVTAEGRLQPIIQTSADGNVWSTVPQQSAFEGTNNQFWALTTTPDGILAVGTYWADGGTGSLPAAWLSSP